MAIKLTEEQELIVNIARDFAINEVRPRIEELETSPTRPLDILARVVELGFRSIMVPEEYGGLGLGIVTQLLVIEQVAREHPTVALMSGNSLVKPFMVAANDKLKEKYLPRIASGELVYGLAFTEASAGSDSSAIQTTAVKDGDHWILNGTKTFTTGCVTYDGFIVTARTNETEPGGISCFVVERGFEGFSNGKPYEKLAWASTETGEIYFKNMRVPAENMIGEENRGLRVALTTLDSARLVMAVHALAYAESAFDKAVAYAKQREQFGQKISEFQIIQHYLADMKTDIEVARAMIYETAEKAEAGERITTEAAMAKLFATGMAMRVCDKAIQICGGYGVTKDGGVERHFREARMLPISEGTNEILKMVVSRAILK